MKPFTPRLLATGVLLLGAGAAAAHAATPESGEVSKANPKVQWTGEVINSYANRIPVIITEDDSFPCLPQSCDMFTLNVKETDDLTLTADAPESTSTDGSSGSQVTLRIRKPDGSVSVHTTEQAGASPEKPLVVKLKKAATGTYEIEYYNYYLATAGFIPYTATATLGTPSSAPAPVNQGAGEQPGTTPSTGQPGSQPEQPPAQQEIAVTVKTGKLSARRIKKSRKLNATVSVSREVQKVTATLKKGKKVVGKGKLGRVQGAAKLTVKLAKKVARKLKKGTYALTVAATDNAGSSGVRTVKLKIRK